MKEIYKYLRILALLGFSWGLASIGSSAYCAQFAIVTATRATVYADKQLTSPIGIIKQGKKIKVGEVVRRYGTILPTVVAGKVAYIETKNIQLESELVKLEEEDNDTKKDAGGFEHKVMNDVTNELHDSLSENNHLSLAAGQGATSGDWEGFGQAVGQTHPNSSFFKIAFEHRPQFFRTSWAVGLGFEQSSGTQAKLDSNFFDFNFYYAFFKTGLVTLEANVGLQAYPQIRIQSNNTVQDEITGSGWGYQLGGRLVLFPHSFLSLFGELKIQSTKYANFENIQFTNGSADFSLSSSRATLMLLGLSVAI